MKSKILNEAIKDEKSAPVMYKRLLKNIKGKVNKNKIKSIIRDEKRHLKLLKNIK